jgi:hypothetical protein
LIHKSTKDPAVVGSSTNNGKFGLWILNKINGGFQIKQDGLCLTEVNFDSVRQGSFLHVRTCVGSVQQLFTIRKYIKEIISIPIITDMPKKLPLDHLISPGYGYKHQHLNN